MKILTLLATVLATFVGATALAFPAAADGLSTGHHGVGFVTACVPAESGPHDYTIAAADGSIKAIGADSWEVVSTDGTSRRVQAMNGTAQVRLDSPPASVNGVRLHADVADGTPVALVVVDQPACADRPTVDSQPDPVVADAAVTRTPPRPVQPVVAAAPATTTAAGPRATAASGRSPSVLAHTGTSVLLLAVGAAGLVLLGLGARTVADRR